MYDQFVCSLANFPMIISNPWWNSPLYFASIGLIYSASNVIPDNVAYFSITQNSIRKAMSTYLFVVNYCVEIVGYLFEVSHESVIWVPAKEELKIYHWCVWYIVCWNLRGYLVLKRNNNTSFKISTSKVSVSMLGTF